jgi:phage terminase small subunit
MASHNLKNPKVIRAIAERREQLAAVAGVDRALIVRELLAIATADPRKLTQTRRGCCRHCWGIDHKREWTEAEYSTALNEALMSMLLPPEFEGGLGYRPTREPSPDCPMCAGEGLTRTWVVDVRDLDDNTAKLYAGVKQTKDGFEVKQNDRIKAIELLGRYLGMFTDKTELSGPGGGPIPLAVATVGDLTDDQLLALAMAGSDASLGVLAGVHSPSMLPANTIEGT